MLVRLGKLANKLANSHFDSLKVTQIWRRHSRKVGTDAEVLDKVVHTQKFHGKRHLRACYTRRLLKRDP